MISTVEDMADSLFWLSKRRISVSVLECLVKSRHLHSGGASARGESLVVCVVHLKVGVYERFESKTVLQL